ncbi:MAG TPA: hypothetical protein VFV72_05845 [Candidatus Limnocylindrales bacterium]|nr:hypothetical protein [Candidatus Limnocylindrales bacterium]
MALEVEEILSLWREGERLLEELADDAPQRRLVAAEVVELKRIYRRLTNESDVTAHILVQSREAIATAHDAVASARTVLEGTRNRLNAE